MGGYVAGPPVMAALLRRRPVVVMEPNAVPGFTNRVIGRFVSRALISFPETASYFRAGRTEITGLPVREEFFRIPPKPRSGAAAGLDHRRKPGVAHAEPRRPRELAAVPRSPAFQYVWSIRPGRPNASGCAANLRNRVSRAKSFLLSPTCPRRSQRPTWWSAGRAPARCRNWPPPGSPSILVPFPFAADDHQTRNAEALARGGAARLVRDADMNGEKLFSEIQELARDTGALERMAQVGPALRQAGRGAARGGHSGGGGARIAEEFC